MMPLGALAGATEDRVTGDDVRGLLRQWLVAHRCWPLHTRDRHRSGAGRAGEGRRLLRHCLRRNGRVRCDVARAERLRVGPRAGVQGRGDARLLLRRRPASDLAALQPQRALQGAETGADCVGPMEYVWKAAFLTMEQLYGAA